MLISEVRKIPVDCEILLGDHGEDLSFGLNQMDDSCVFAADSQGAYAIARKLQLAQTQVEISLNTRG